MPTKRTTDDSLIAHAGKRRPYHAKEKRVTAAHVPRARGQRPHPIASLFGMAPAWITSRSDPADALRGAGRSTEDHSSLPQRSLVIVQVALSAILLVGAGLLTQSLRNLENQNFGFEAQGRLMIRVDPSLAGYTPEKLYGLYHALQNRLPQIPGVLSTSYSLWSPLRVGDWAAAIYLEGHAADERNGASWAYWERVGPRYFETIGTRLLRGRTLVRRTRQPRGASLS